MPIKVTCPDCFRDYKVQDQFAGKKFKCKECGAVLTARKAKPKAKVVEDYDDWEEVEDDEADDDYLPPPRPRRKPAAQPARRKRAASGGAALPSLGLPVKIFGGVMLALLGLSFVSGIAALTFLMASILTALALVLHGGLRMLIIPFQEDVVCGLLYLFVPFYPLYYLITRWDEMWHPFVTALAGWLLFMFILGFAQLMGAMRGAALDMERPAVVVCCVQTTVEG